jgi:hypothetical protein
MERTSACGFVILVAVVLAGCGRAASNYVPPAGSGPTLGNDAVLLSAADLKAEAKLIGQHFYWAGPRKGREYEFQRASNGYVYVRYLPQGVPAGDSGQYPLVATYPFRGAYNGVKATANGAGLAGPGGSIVFPRPDHQGSVLMAFHHIDYEIEVFAPTTKNALRIVMSGRVRPIG